MYEHWTVFETWLEAHWPEGRNGLNPPATEQEIGALEHALGISLPEDYKACLRIHNGQDTYSGGLFENAEFLSTHAVREQWEIWQSLLSDGQFEGIQSSPEDGIKADWWNTKWIPFTHNGGGDHYCLDLDPAPGGQHGQIITMWHDMDEREKLSSSFAHWFQSYVSDVIAGKYVYSDEYGGLTPIDEL
ncbi:MULTISPECIES: SMI1/KNR4 family protein [Pectobacterium]|uniref:SMI1/KNR4 family protein n=1 Tax=Pectobacterium TaxID=122277 RepID=UPI0015DF2C2D|nr:SMI1/KNR4 family protein [Pectobacterium sp. CFBP8739]MBA0166831.1 SMI1/KNR4 family protein [Pectobacterium sp. CFBP8739]